MVKSILKKLELVTDIAMTSDSSQDTEMSGPKTCCEAQQLRSLNMHVSHRTIFSSQYHLILHAQLSLSLSIHSVRLASTGYVHNTASVSVHRHATSQLSAHIRVISCSPPQARLLAIPPFTLFYAHLNAKNIIMPCNK